MDRNRSDSSRLGDQQADGNLGNERNRNSPDSSSRERGRSSESMINRSSENSSVRERSRDSEDRGSSEEWSPSSESSDNNDARRGGSER